MKDMKQDREDFWLDLGPATEWADMPPEPTAAENGDASPDGKRRGFSGAEAGTVYEPHAAYEDARRADLNADGTGRAEPQPAPTQTPDVSTGNIPPELPPLPPETWPGL